MSCVNYISSPKAISFAQEGKKKVRKNGEWGAVVRRKQDCFTQQQSSLKHWLDLMKYKLVASCL